MSTWEPVLLGFLTRPTVIGGIDTHKDPHVVAVLDTSGVVLATEAFSTTRAGYRVLTRWLQAFGDVRLVGIEGTGSYGAGITRPLLEAASRSSRLTGPTAPTGAAAARTTPSTLRTPPAPPWPASARPHPGQGGVQGDLDLVLEVQVARSSRPSSRGRS